MTDQRAQCPSAAGRLWLNVKRTAAILALPYLQESLVVLTHYCRLMISLVGVCITVDRGDIDVVDTVRPGVHSLQ